MKHLKFLGKPSSPPENIHFNMTLHELDVAIEAAIDLAKIACITKGDNSHDCLTAWTILAEMQSEVASRRGV
jgi:hypothetical protein